MACLASVLLETLVERSEERLALAGTANLTRGGMLDFQGTLRPVLEALEEEVILLKLIGEVEPSTTRIRIGDENEFDNLRSDVGGEHRLRAGRHDRWWARRARAHPDGLPRHHRYGACSGTLRWRATGPELTRID